MSTLRGQTTIPPAVRMWVCIEHRELETYLRDLAIQLHRAHKRYRRRQSQRRGWLRISSNCRKVSRAWSGTIRS
jgi:hypothetical protein